MRTFLVQAVGQPMGPLQTIEAYNPYYAVAEVAGCAVNDVCAPIWSDGEKRPSNGYLRSCFMPRDNSGRQWLVTRPEGLTLR